MAVHRSDNHAAAPVFNQGAVAGDSANPGRARPRRTAWMTAAVMLAVVGGVYLVQQHWTHLAGNWVYLALLACPLMHLFMHRGHGNHGSHGGHHPSDGPSGRRHDPPN